MGLAPVRPLEGGFTWHLTALLFSAAVVGLGLVRAPDAAGLRERALGSLTPAPDADARMEALHALSQRDAAAIDGELVARLLADPELRVRELAFTNVISRHTGKQALAPSAAALADPGEAWRARFWLQRDVASRRWITRADLEDYFASLDGYFASPDGASPRHGTETR